MANKVWTGATDDANLATNYAPSGVPADGDTIFCTDQAQNDMASNLAHADWQSKTVGIVVEKSFIKKIGASGNPFTPGGISTLVFSGGGGPCYFAVDDGAAAGGSDAIARLIVDTQTQTNDMVNIASGNVTRIVARRGKVTLSSGVVVTNRISVSGGDLTIPTGVTLTGVETKVKEGTMTCSSSLPVLVVDGGQFTLAGAADIDTYLEMSGGKFSWDAAGASGDHSIIALAEIFGGIFETRSERDYRTLTECNMYDEGTVNLQKGGLLLTLTNGIRCFGNKRPVFPAGSKYSVVV